MQSALERSYLDIKNGSIRKYERMHAKDYQEVLFLTEPISFDDGGFIARFFSNTEIGKDIVDRFKAPIRLALQSAMNDGSRRAVKFTEQVSLKRAQLETNRIVPMDYSELTNNPPPQILRQYGDRSIVKEIDQLLSPLRIKDSGESSIEITAAGTEDERFYFDKQRSKNFHKVVSEKNLGNPVIYSSYLLELDAELSKGRIKNIGSGKKATIHFTTSEALVNVSRFLGRNSEVMRFIGCPLIEYGAFDPEAGDIYFVSLLENNG